MRKHAERDEDHRCWRQDKKLFACNDMQFRGDDLGQARSIVIRGEEDHVRGGSATESWLLGKMTDVMLTPYNT